MNKTDTNIVISGRDQEYMIDGIKYNKVNVEGGLSSVSLIKK